MEVLDPESDPTTDPTTKTMGKIDSEHVGTSPSGPTITQYLSYLPLDREMYLTQIGNLTKVPDYLPRDDGRTTTTLQHVWTYLVEYWMEHFPLLCTRSHTIGDAI